MPNEQQPLTDLIPKSHASYWGVVLLSFGGMAGLCYGYIDMPALAEKIGAERIVPLDLNAPGSLFAWWMSLLWLLAAAVAWFNFKRRRKESTASENERERPFADLTDIWLWGTLACLFFSVDAAVRLRELLCDIMLRYGGARFNGGGDFWWIGLYVMFFFGLIGTRLVLEMRRFWPAVGFFVVSMSLFAAAGAIQLGFLENSAGQDGTLKPEEAVMLRCTAEMSATLLLLIAFTVFARHLVLLDPEVVMRWLGATWKPQDEFAAPASTSVKKDSPTIPNPAPAKEPDPPNPAEKPMAVDLITADGSGVAKSSRPASSVRKLPNDDQSPEELARRRHAVAEPEA